MLSLLADYLQRETGSLVGVVPFSSCRVIRPEKLRRQGFGETRTPASVLMFAVPYYAGVPGKNLSLYAVPEDYHLYYESVLPPLCRALEAAYPAFRFVSFSDNSPILEVDAAAAAGLGDVGEAGLLLTEPYGSLVFLAEIISDAPPSLYALEESAHKKLCTGCGACRRACPMPDGAEKAAACFSALTQQKGPLTGPVRHALLVGGSAWGCDRCQLACPVTRRAMETPRPVPFFAKQLLPHLTADMLGSFDAETFSRRAYAWRGRETVLRNLRVLEEPEKEATP